MEIYQLLRLLGLPGHFGVSSPLISAVLSNSVIDKELPSLSQVMCLVISVRREMKSVIFDNLQNIFCSVFIPAPIKSSKVSLFLNIMNA